MKTQIENPEHIETEKKIPHLQSKILSETTMIKSKINDTLSENANNGVNIRELKDFDPNTDLEFFHSLEGEDGWMAIGMKNCMNQRYYIVIGENDKKLGIVGVYDTEDEKNITHIVINPEYRSKKIGKSLLPNFYNELLKKAGLKSLIATINPDNMASIKSHEKAGFLKVNDPKYDWKLKYKFSIE